jgi:hypothetical protein
MKKNIGTIDRVTRILTAAIIAFLYFTNVITGTLAIILIGVALVLLVTGFLSFCPLYFVLGFKSIKKNS